ncbi:MAG: hypothetical protein SOX76_04510 [Candidatus Enterosoma sp.]|nr:hypothetical protein [Candidatus Enterosoma sp.]MDY5431883.1 hypothetical protein [Candidatus Enterosoma sp.]
MKIEPLFEEQVDFDTFSKSDFRAVKVKECSAVPKSKKLLKFVLDDGTGTDRVILSGIHAYYEPEELVGKTLIAITNLPPRAMMGIDSCGMLLSAVNEKKRRGRASSSDGGQPHPCRRIAVLIYMSKTFKALLFRIQVPTPPISAYDYPLQSDSACIYFYRDSGKAVHFY